MRFFFRFLLISMFLAGGTVACSGGNGTNCTSNDNCSDGKVCCEGSCKVSSECSKACTGTKCQSQDDCSNNQTCTDGCCVDKGTACTGTKCQSKDDCTNGQVCQNNCCVDGGGGPSCKKVDDCAEGQDCVGASGSGVCQACAKTCDSSLDCSGDGITCYRGCCRAAPCTNDSGCSDPSKPRCNTETGQCVACVENKDCQELSTICDSKLFSCKKVECTDDADCPSTKPVCNKEVYRCEEEPVCKVDADCTDPQLSRCDPKADGGKGACKKGACTPCTSDDECGPDADYCISTSQGLKDGRKCLRGCTENSDCPTGFDCEESVGGKAIVGPGIKVCFPRIQYCSNPCDNKQCNSDEFCNLEKGGVCELKPAACKPCLDGDASACNEPGKTGNQCLDLGGNKFCGKACSSDSDCPTDQKSGDGSTREFKCVGGQCTALDGCK
ncbi:MAG: hypothetical protein EP343_17790 [Deltaproteobacteria bacterium]|nr:MAG: hypothetical protein EP343_17790 [Deltaproteobacteria bacterium]